jgi:hypothetical protein
MGRGKKSSVFDFYKHAGPLGLRIECAIIEELFVPSRVAVVVADHRFAFRRQCRDAPNNGPNKFPPRQNFVGI